MKMRRLTSFVGNWIFDFIQDWTQFFEDCNWYTFRAAWIEFENDKILGGYEFTVVLLGIGFRIRYNHTETDTMRGLNEQVAAIKAGTIKTTPYPMYQLDDGDPHCACEDDHKRFEPEQMKLNATEEKESL